MTQMKNQSEAVAERRQKVRIRQIVRQLAGNEALKDLVCLLLNGTSALFRPLVPRIV